MSIPLCIITVLLMPLLNYGSFLVNYNNHVFFLVKPWLLFVRVDSVQVTELNFFNEFTAQFRHLNCLCEILSVTAIEYVWIHFIEHIPFFPVHT